MALSIVVLGVAMSASIHRLERWLDEIDTALPSAAPASLYALLFDQTPLTVMTTVEWRKVPVAATVDQVRSDPALWRQMFFDDWDRLPAALRDDGLERMWRRYQDVVRAPSRWDRMTPREWDLVPQPVRGMAFIEMVRYWSGYYQVGTDYGLPRGTVTNTLAAILIAESGFVHRAITVNAAGNRDIGLAQASDGTRASLARLQAAGLIDFAPADDAGYENPWQATRVLVLWFDLMLDETGGDLDLAIRAYHRGAPFARAGEGADYLRNVVDRRRRYLRDETRSPTWTFLRAKVRALPASPKVTPDASP